MSWDILYLAAEDPVSGEPLWPEFFPKAFLDDKRRIMGSALYRCMYLGDPEGLLGDLFDPSWFGEARIHLAPRGEGEGAEATEVIRWLHRRGRPAISFDHLLIYQFWDLAISEKQTADYTCCVTLALDPSDMSLAVLHVFRDHLSFEKTQQQMALLAETWRPHAIGIESIAYQAAAVQQARQHLLFPIRETKVDRDKVSRARLPSALAEQGNISVVRDARWTGEFLDELASFPGGRHDDMVDALSGACALAQSYVPSSMFLWG